MKEPYRNDHEKSGQRMCPICGALAEAEHCPHDGARTVVVGAQQRSALSFQVGDIIGGRYRTSGVIGRGGFAAVYAAVHTDTQQPVAIKMLSLESAEDHNANVRRFYREARITAGLTDPHTVRVFDVGQAEGGPVYQVMELLTGRTLEQLLNSHDASGTTMHTEDVVRVGLAVLSSLAEAHEQRLVHRDLKPANIMMTHAGSGGTFAKVLDFGIARLGGSSLTGTGRALGTPAYMSPEQVSGSTIDGRSDLYSLCIVLYRCLSGRLPFNDVDPFALAFQHVTQLPPPLSQFVDESVDEGLVQLVMGGLEKDPNDRPQSAAAMSAALEAFATANSDRPRRIPGIRTLAATRGDVSGGDPLGVDEEELAVTPVIALGNGSLGPVIDLKSDDLETLRGETGQRRAWRLPRSVAIASGTALSLTGVFLLIMWASNVLETRGGRGPSNVQFPKPDSLSSSRQDTDVARTVPSVVSTPPQPSTAGPDAVAGDAEVARDGAGGHADVKVTDATTPTARRKPARKGTKRATRRSAGQGKSAAAGMRRSATRSKRRPTRSTPARTRRPSPVEKAALRTPKFQMVDDPEAGR